MAASRIGSELCVVILASLFYFGTSSSFGYDVARVAGAPSKVGIRKTEGLTRTTVWSVPVMRSSKLRQRRWDSPRILRAVIQTASAVYNTPSLNGSVGVSDFAAGFLWRDDLFTNELVARILRTVYESNITA